MIREGNFVWLTCMLICLKIVLSHNAIDEDQRLSNKININPSMDRIFRYTPEMRLMLNGFLRYQNIAKRPEDNPYSSHLTQRSKGSSATPEDPLATLLATGFMGSRGKKDDTDEIPVFANGFPAGRG